MGDNFCEVCFKMIFNDGSSTAVDLCDCHNIQLHDERDKRRLVWDLFFIEYPEYKEMVEKYNEQKNGKSY